MDEHDIKVLNGVFNPKVNPKDVILPKVGKKGRRRITDVREWLKKRELKNLKNLAKIADDDTAPFRERRECNIALAKFTTTPPEQKTNDFYINMQVLGEKLVQFEALQQTQPQLDMSPRPSIDTSIVSIEDLVKGEKDLDES